MSRHEEKYGATRGGQQTSPVQFKPRFNPLRTFTSSSMNSPQSGKQASSIAGSGVSAPERVTGTASPRPLSSELRFNPHKMFSPGSSDTPLVASAASSPSVPELYHPPLHPLQYHLYAPSPYRVGVHVPPNQRLVEDLFISNRLRQDLQERNEATLQVLSASALPDFVHVYHSLVPLDTKEGGKERFGYHNWRYKAISSSDGRTYCLLRLSDLPIENELCLTLINKWKRVNSASFVGIVEAFTTHAFKDDSLIVVYEYYPMSRTAVEVFSTPPSEGVLWSLAAQLAAGLQAIHSNKLAARVVDMRSVLVTEHNRLRLGSCGVLDIIDAEASSSSGDKTHYPQASSIGRLQQSDWRQLGDLLVAIASAGHAGSSQWAAIEAKYSAAIVEFLHKLKDDADATQVVQLLAPHMWRLLDGSLAQVDSLERTLSKELENGRVARLLAKLEFVWACSGAEPDERWQPNGTRYPLVLFRDYVFHQVDVHGRVQVNLAHVLTALNKLDAGIDEKILLTSRDGKTRLVVSCFELNAMFEQAFREIPTNAK